MLPEGQAGRDDLAGIHGGGRATRANWLGNLDSNQDKQSQSLLCYRYTIPQSIADLI